MWPGSDQAFCSPHRLCPLSGFGGCSLLPGLSRVRSLLGPMSLGQVWTGQALNHGLENPSLVICQLSLRPKPVTVPPTSPRNPGLGALGGRCPFIVRETPSIILKPSLMVPMCPPLSGLVLGKLLALRSSWNPLPPFGVVVLPPTLRKLEHREVEKLAQGHSASE